MLKEGKRPKEIEEFPIAVTRKHFGDEDLGIEGDIHATEFPDVEQRLQVFRGVFVVSVFALLRKQQSLVPIHPDRFRIYICDFRKLVDLHNIRLVTQKTSQKLKNVKKST